MSIYGLQPVAILWDIENCAVPRGVNAENVGVRIRRALKVQLALRGPITVFSAYGDFSRFAPHIRQGCQKTGVSLIDTPHGSKDAADKAILVDMFLFAFDNPPPCTVVLISGDVDFAPALHKLGQRGYCVVLAIPSGLNVSPALCNACQHIWSWPDVARGKCLTPEKHLLTCTLEECKPSETVALNAGIKQVKGNHQEAGPSGLKNTCEVPRKFPAGMFEEYVKVPSRFLKESTKIPVMMGADHNSTRALDMNQSVLPTSCSPVASHMTGHEGAAPLTSQAINLGFAVPCPYEEFGHILKGPAAAYNAGTADVVANRPANPAVRGGDKDSSLQPHSQNVQKQFAKFKNGNSACKQVARANCQNPSLPKKKKKKKKGKLEAGPLTFWARPKQPRRSARLAARKAQGL